MTNIFLQKNKEYDVALKSIWYLFFSIILFWLLIYILVPFKGSRQITLLSSTISGLFSLLTLTYFIVRKKIIKKSAFLCVSFAYLIRVGFGTLHYIFSIDGSYFSRLSKFGYLYDYEWLNNSMIEVSDYWKEYGFGIMSPEFFISNKNAIITAYMSLIYYLGDNNHFLNIVVLNSFHNILVAILVSIIAYAIIGPKASHTILLIVLFQPFGFATDIFWRDSVGQFFVILSIALLLFSELNLKGFFFLTFSTFFTFIHRTAYLPANMAIYFYKNFILSGQKKITLKILAIIIFVAIYIIFGEYLNEISKVQNYITSEGDTNTSITSGGIVFTFLKGLTGPFPWHQIFNKKINGREYLFYDMLQASYCMVIYYIVLKQLIINSKNKLKNIEIFILLSVSIYMSFGLFSYGHIAYTSLVSVLLFTIMKNLQLRDFLNKWALSIIFYIFSSFLWFVYKEIF